MQKLSQLATSQDNFSRPLGNLEVFFKKLADLGASLQREHWAVHLALRLKFVGSNDIEVSNPVPYLQKAWQAVRYQHLAIGSTIVLPSVNPDANSKASHAARARLNIPSFEADTWLHNTFIVDPGHGDANSLFSDLRSSPTIMCYWLPQSGELVIRSSHWRLDGIGMLTLEHSFLKALREVLRLGSNFSLDSYRDLPASAQYLPQNLEELAINRAAEIPENHSEALEAGANALVAEFLRGVPSVALPTRAGSEEALPGASSRLQVRLDASTTAEVTAARQDKGIGFTGAVHAAIVQVTATYPQHPLSKAYAAFFSDDLRQCINTTGAATKNELVFGLYFSGLPICVDGILSDGDEAPSPKSFDQVAGEMTAIYGRDLAKFWTASNGEMVVLLELAEPLVARTTALFSTPVPEGLPPTQTPDLSGLGKLEAYLQHEYRSSPEAPKVEVEDVCIGTEMLNRCVQFHVWSWKDELTIGASFNQIFYEKNFVVEVLDKVVKELLMRSH
jgi:hypothetical protein